MLQFAYNEMSFMLIRLLQNFSAITLCPESQDPADRPPAAWAQGEGRQVIEQFHPRRHLTLYAKVWAHTVTSTLFLNAEWVDYFIGRLVGKDGTRRDLASSKVVIGIHDTPKDWFI